jgi:hypothetical protein
MTHPIPSIMLDRVPAAGPDGLIEIPIAVTGMWKRGASEFSLTKHDLAQMAENFRKRKNGEINVDYDHASEMPEVARGGPVPSAGRIIKMRSNGALYAGIEFTARAVEYIKAKEYRFVSPAIAWGMKDKITGEDQGATLTSLALTNRPFLEEIPAIRLSEIGSGASGLDAEREEIMEESRSEANSNSRTPKGNKLVRWAKDRAKERGESFATALVYVARENPQLAVEARTEALAYKVTFEQVGGHRVAVIETDPVHDLSWVVANMAKERSAEKGIGFSQALSEVSKENPALIARYRAQVLGIG